MKRRIFFWLEKLKITPAERKTVSGLMITLSLLAAGNMVLSPPKPFGDGQYTELKKQFRERSGLLREELEDRMRRYDPPEKKGAVTAAATDTVPADSAREKKLESSSENGENLQNGLVNVNEAGQELLKTLPGIGPAYSKRIITYREEYGEFETKEELKQIKGIGAKRLEKLKPLIKL